MNGNKCDAIVKTASDSDCNDESKRCVKHTVHESVAGRLSVFTAKSHDHDHEDGVVKNDGSRMGESHLSRL